MVQSKKSYKKRKKFITLKIKTKKSLLQSAITDHLTKLYNRRYFEMYLKDIIKVSKKEKNSFALLIIDINNFKQINDRYGHVAGDKILIDLAKVLKKSVRKIDICSRYGGDEITIILPHATKSVTTQVAKRIKTAIETHVFSIEGKYSLKLQLSTGMAIYPDDGFFSYSLIKKADDALYRVKRQKQKVTEPFILRTKLSPPVLKKTIIPRQRLLSLLDGNLDKKLICVVADAGYGKTTLLTQFVTKTEIPYVWYRIDKSDQDITLFIRYLIEGMRRYLPSFGKRTLGVIRHSPDREIKLEILIGTFINELVEVPEQKIVFIFDDLQEIYESQKVVAGLEYLLNHLPTTISIIISARSKPAFSLERFYLKNEIVDLDQQDLRFNKNEIKILCKHLSGYSPKPIEVEQLEADSEGWITCLQFFAQRSEQRPIFAQSKTSLLNRLFDYFDQEIYSSLEEDIKFFLMATSVLDDMSPGACDFLLTRNDSEHILKELQKKHLFISAYDAPQPLYGYHRLFQNFLSSKLREKGLQQKFQNRAGAYLEKIGDVGSAVQHYYEAKNFKSIARLLEQHGEDYLEMGKHEFVKQHIACLPESVLNTSSVLMRLRGKICHWECDWDGAQKCYVRAKRLAQQKKNTREILETTDALLTMKLFLGKHEGIRKQINKVLRSKKLKDQKLRARLLNNLGIALSYEGKIKQAIAVFEKIVKIDTRTGYTEHLKRTLHNLAIAHMNLGNFSRAKDYFEIVKNQSRSQPSPTHVKLLNNLGISLIMQGNTIEADKVLHEALQYAQLFNDKLELCVCFHHLGQAKLGAGDLQSAEQLFEKAEKIALDINHKFSLATIWDSMAELAHVRGDLYKAQYYSTKSLEIPIFLTQGLYMITKAKIEVSLRHLNVATKILKRVLPHVRCSHYLLMVYYLQMARVALFKKNQAKAQQYIKKSITIAEKCSYDYLIIDELRQYPEMIQLLKKAGVRSYYLKRILLQLPDSGMIETIVEPVMKDYDFVVRLFNRVQIFKSEKEIKPKVWRTRRYVELFSFFIAHRGYQITREKITNTFWPDHKPKVAHQLFYNSLYAIRKTLGKDIIFFDKKGYSVSQKYHYWIDTEEFETRISRAHRLLKDDNNTTELLKYEEALTLYRGRFMDNFYSEWCEQKRQYFEDLYLSTLKKISHGHYKMGNFEKALKFCDILMSKDPYNEEAHCIAMRCYAALNDLGGLQDCFSRLKKTLSHDLKIIPRSETVQLFKTLLKQRITSLSH